MTVDTVTLSDTNVSPGSGTILESFVPAAGELYYVDRVIFTCHGDGSGGTDTNRPILAYLIQNANLADTHLSVTENAAWNSQPTGARVRNTDSNYQSNNPHTAIAQVDEYINSGDKFLLGFQYNDEGATVDYSVEMRRII